MIRDTGQMTRANIDDGDMWIAEFASGALASIQSSYVTVGNYPGIEARIYGSEGALIVRLVDEFGICQTIKTARKDAVEFVEEEIPARFFPPGGHSGEPWEYLFYSNLVSDFTSEILDGGRASQGDFAQGALVQETINAFEARSGARAWVSFPLGAARASRQRRERHRQRGRLVTPGAGGGGLARAGRPARLPGRPRRPAVRAAGHGRGHAGRALRGPGHRLRLRPPGARRVGPAPRPRRRTWRCSS